MTKYLIAIFILIICLSGTYAQDSIPLLKGRIDISVSNGTMACDLTLSRLPKIENYYIRLNSGMNIRYIKSGSGKNPLSYDKSLQDSLSSGESNAYFITAYNDQGKFLPRAIHLVYTGMFPVIADTASAVDWRGNIAFNGKTLRTDGIQSAWYPLLYDVNADAIYNAFAYDIEVNCADCKEIYVNGSRPVTGTHATFKSEVPYELTLFCGEYRTVEINDTYFLNPDMDDSDLVKFESITRRYKKYFENNLHIPYKGIATYIQTTPVSKHNSWMFNSYPAIIDIGFGKKASDRFSPYFSHELAHYYFGTTRNFNSEMGDAMTEGFAEYLAMHIARKFAGDSLFYTKVVAKLKALQHLHAIPFASVRSQKDYDDRELYSYYFAPLIFIAIEKEIGEDAMWRWQRALLQTPASFTNYHFLEQTLRDVLKDQKKMDFITEKYFTSDSVIEHIRQALTAENNGPSNKPTLTATNQPEIKTYYYFFFAKPMVDAGANENRSILHTNIGTVTCTAAELSNKTKLIVQKVRSACENEAGCSLDFNTYDSLEQAQSALQRWLKPYSGNSLYVIKTIQ